LIKVLDIEFEVELKSTSSVGFSSGVLFALNLFQRRFERNSPVNNKKIFCFGK
jgi:hypothetical protein